MEREAWKEAFYTEDILSITLKRIDGLEYFCFLWDPPNVLLVFRDTDAKERFMGVLDFYTEVFGDEEANALFEMGWESREIAGEERQVLIDRKLLEKCMEALVSYAFAFHKNGRVVLNLRGKHFALTPHPVAGGVLAYYSLDPLDEYRGLHG